MNFKSYQHFKGGLYIVLCEGKHTETNEILVTYVSAASGEVYHRPKSMFYDTVSKPNYKGLRFTPVPSESINKLGGVIDRE